MSKNFDSALNGALRTLSGQRGVGHPMNGAVVAFEGIDGAGKSAVLDEVHRILVDRTPCKVSRIAFPGRDAGTLGNHVYQLHHAPERFGIKQMSPLSLQLLHVAAHIDAIDNLIRPSLTRGELILLDRYWWSTWVYGLVAGANEEFLQSIIHLERKVWGEIKPAVVFLVRRGPTSDSTSERVLARRLNHEYEKLASAESHSVNVAIIDNDSSVEASAQTVVSHLEEILSPALR